MTELNWEHEPVDWIREPQRGTLMTPPFTWVIPVFCSGELPLTGEQGDIVGEITEDGEKKVAIWNEGNGWLYFP